MFTALFQSLKEEGSVINPGSFRWANSAARIVKPPAFGWKNIENTCVSMRALLLCRAGFVAVQGSCGAWHVPGDEEPSLTGLKDTVRSEWPWGPPGTLTLPMEEHPYNPNARLKEIYSLYCACPKMSPSDFGVPEDSDVEENHHSQLTKECWFVFLKKKIPWGNCRS